MKKLTIFIFVLLALVLLSAAISPVRIAVLNTLGFYQQKTDDATNYKTRKEVEDTCRAMIASYETDRLTYEQFRGSDSAEKLEWAEQAKMRANKTASSYNNFILKNSFVWSGNIPDDINRDLAFIE